jgi:hypothetical protein
VSEQQPSRNKVLLTLAPFFETVIKQLEPPYMKFLFGLDVVLLLALLMVSKNIHPGLGLGLIVLVVLAFAILAFALTYIEMRFRYSKRTEEELKKALRDTVMQLQEGRIEQHLHQDVRVTHIQYDPPGDDVQGEFVAITNAARTAIDITNWTLCDEVGHLFEFPEFILQPQAHVRIWTKAGASTATDLYWGRNQAVWDNAGDCAYLRDSAGALIATYRYGRPYPSSGGVGDG